MNSNLTKFQIDQAHLLLAELGYTILVIEEDTYLVDIFDPSDIVTFRHLKFKGCTIDKVIESNVHLLTGQVQETLQSVNRSKYETLTQKLDQLKRYEFQFHGDIRWKLITT